MTHRHHATPTVAVVVLNWNGLDLLKEFAPQWIAAQPSWADLIVVDNGSSDGSVAYLKEHHPEIEVMCFEENYGFAEGYNRAIAQLPHEFVVLLNSDATPLGDWLSSPIQRLQADPSIAAIQPKIRSYREPSYFEYAGAAGGYLDPLGYPYCRGRVMGSVEADLGQYDTEVEIMWASGACLIIRRAIYLAVGGLDARFFAHQEEIDLAWRIKARGWRIVCDPHSVVLHLGGASLAMYSPRKIYLNHRNNLLMLYKNLPALRLTLTLALRLGLDFAAACSYLLRGQPRSFVAVLRGMYDALMMSRTFASDRAHNLAITIVQPRDILSKRSIFFLR